MVGECGEIWDIIKNGEETIAFILNKVAKSSRENPKVGRVGIDLVDLFVIEDFTNFIGDLTSVRQNKETEMRCTKKGWV